MAMVQIMVGEAVSCRYYGLSNCSQALFHDVIMWQSLERNLLRSGRYAGSPGTEPKVLTISRFKMVQKLKVL